MKKTIILLFICFWCIFVKADMEPPRIIKHKVMVTNKDGAICYQDGKKTNQVIPYGTTLDVDYDIDGSYISVSNDKYYCDVKYVDVSSKTQNFSLDNSDVEKIDSVRVIVLAKGGLNLRKGPSVTYSKLITIPQYSSVKVSYKAGTYWYYTEYNGVYGWITAINGYVGFESNEVLYNYEKVNIYDSSKKIIGTIPANTEITDYLVLDKYTYDDFNYFVIYNGIKGYIGNMYYKTNGVGKIKLLKDIELTDNNGKLIKKLTANQDMEYNMKGYGNTFYIPEKNVVVALSNDEFEYMKEVKLLKKDRGYVGEGLFGEAKEERVIEEEEEVIPPVIEKEKDNSTIIIICLLAGILVSLIALVIVKIMNKKRDV